jgi:hypothetical protein
MSSLGESLLSPEQAGFIARWVYGTLKRRGLVSEAGPCVCSWEEGWRDAKGWVDHE